MRLDTRIFESCDITVHGPCKPLRGYVGLSGCKNVAMPTLVAAALSTTPMTVINVPRIQDVYVLLKILEIIGLSVDQRESEVSLAVVRKVNEYLIPDALSSRLRGSVYTLAIPAVRSGRAVIGRIGGDVISGRSLAPHARALAGFGLQFTQINRGWALNGKRAKSGEFALKDKGISATCLAILIAAAIEGRSVIREASLEIECDDVLRAVRTLGAKAERDGRTLLVEGPMAPETDIVDVPFDQLAWGTLAIATAATGGSLDAPSILARRAEPIIQCLQEFGVTVTTGNTLHTEGSPSRGVDIATGMYPMFPSDLLPQAMVLGAIAPGKSIFKELHYNHRFGHVGGLQKMGARIEISGRTALVYGPCELRNQKVHGSGIRETAALVLAGLAAKGPTVIERAEAIYRGYENLPGELTMLGAQISPRRSAHES